MRKTKTIAATLLCIAAVDSRAAAYSNGSFESLTLADGQQRAIDDSVPRRSLESWMISGRVVARDPLGSELIQSTEGNNYVFLEDGATISQTFDTVAGNAYSVSYDYSKTRGAVEVLVNGQVYDRQSDVREVPMQAAIGFYFTATGSSTTLTFVSPQEQFNGGVGRLALDHVVVEPSNVPEPAKWMMWMVGLMMIGNLARRRHLP